MRKSDFEKLVLDNSLRAPFKGSEGVAQLGRAAGLNWLKSNLDWFNKKVLRY